MLLEVGLLDCDIRRAILDVKTRCYKCIAANGEHFEKMKNKVYIYIGGDVLCRMVGKDWKGVE